MEGITQKQIFELYNKPLPIEHIEKIQRETLEIIKKVASKYKNVVLGWSAGKDSIVACDLMEKSKIVFKPVLWQTIFQFPQTQEWIKENAPKGLETVLIPKPTWEELERNSSMLFPLTKADDTRWMSYKWKAQNDFLSKAKCDLFVTGRRTREHNRCGRKDDCWLVRGSKWDTFSPIAEWTTHEILSYMRLNDLPLPWQYYTPYGFNMGSGAWAERMRYGTVKGTADERWKEIWMIDKSIVENAALHLSSARNFLEKVKEL